jgi:hypothetical protein
MLNFYYREASLTADDGLSDTTGYRGKFAASFSSKPSCGVGGADVGAGIHRLLEWGRWRSATRA